MITESFMGRQRVPYQLIIRYSVDTSMKLIGYIFHHQLIFMKAEIFLKANWLVFTWPNTIRPTAGKPAITGNVWIDPQAEQLVKSSVTLRTLGILSSSRYQIIPIPSIRETLGICVVCYSFLNCWIN